MSVKNADSNFVLVANVKEEIDWVLVDKRERQVSFVYALQCEETSRVKIGITQNLHQRLKEIRSMCATNLRLILCIPAIGQEVEAMLHREFGRFRLHGEWFAIPRCKIEGLIRLKMCFEIRMEPDRERENRSDKEIEAIHANGHTVEALNEILRGQDFRYQERVSGLTSLDFETKPIKEFWNDRVHGSKSYEVLISGCYPEHNEIAR